MGWPGFNDRVIPSALRETLSCRAAFRNLGTPLDSHPRRILLHSGMASLFFLWRFEAVNTRALILSVFLLGALWTVAQETTNRSEPGASAQTASMITPPPREIVRRPVDTGQSEHPIRTVLTGFTQVRRSKIQNTPDGRRSG